MTGAYQPGPTNTLLDVGGLRLGHAADAAVKSGVSVVIPDRPAVAGVHVMGGAPGTRETDLLAPDKTVDAVHGLVLGGGSAFGLDAASGVMDALAEDGVGFEVGPVRVPIVPAAILFDLLNGGAAWGDNPYRALGRDAYLAATRDERRLGTVGAGTGAIAGGLKGGLGQASLTLSSGATVAALVAVNSLGHVVSQDGKFWAAPFEQNAEFGGRGVPSAPPLETTFRTKLDAMEGANTTIGVVATSAPLTKAAATRLAVAAHDGLARAILPAHTPMDGDLLFALSTGDGPQTDQITLCHAASLCVARAVARGVYAATPAAGDPVPTWTMAHG